MAFALLAQGLLEIGIGGTQMSRLEPIMGSLHPVDFCF
jgi:hypothetical protein